MKKILLAAVLAGLMSTSVMALEGTVSKVMMLSDGTATISILQLDGITRTKAVAGTAAANSAMIAIALTAKSAGTSTVEAYHDGTIWTTLIIK